MEQFTRLNKRKIGTTSISTRDEYAIEDLIAIGDDNCVPSITEKMQELTPVSDSKPTEKKYLTTTQIILLNCVVCGVEICACAGFTYIPPLLLKAGYKEENMSIILGMGPLLGFFLVPVIGRASDNCHSKYGRRRPFILGLSYLLIVALFIIPYSELATNFLFQSENIAKTASLTCLTFGVVLLDFTSQVCLTPCEALLSDACKGTDQHEKVFTVYSQMVSLGGIFGYLITALDWHSNFIGHFFGNQERSVFTMLIVLFLLMLGSTLMVAQEQPLPRGTTEDEEVKPINKENSVSVNMNNATHESGYESSESDDDDLMLPRSPLKQKKKKFKPRVSIISRGAVILMYPLICLLKLLRISRYIQNLGKFIVGTVYDRLPEQIQKLLDVPYVLKQLALANFCSWTAVMGFNLFFTDFVGQAIYLGNPNAPENSELRNLYDEGVRMGSWGLLFHCITAAVYAFFIERLVDKYGCRWTYFGGLFSFALAMFGMVFSSSIIFVNIMAACTGFAYATLTTVPFILVNKYHADKKVYFFDCQKTVVSHSGNITQEREIVRGIATDMGTMDSAYFLSQVVLSAVMGYVVHLTGSVLSYMVTAGIMGIFSCLFIQGIVIRKQDIFSTERSKNNLRMVSL